MNRYINCTSSRNIYPSGLQLCKKVKEIAERLHIEGFKASNGWINKWKRRHNIRYVKMSGESPDVSGVTVEL